MAIPIESIQTGQIQPVMILDRSNNLIADIEKATSLMHNKAGVIVMNSDDHNDLRQQRKVTHGRHPDDVGILTEPMREIRKVLPETGLDGGRIILNESIKSSHNVTAEIRIIINDKLCADGSIFVCNNVDSDIFEYVTLAFKQL